MQINIDLSDLWNEVIAIDPRLAELAMERVKRKALERRLEVLTSGPSSEDGDEHQQLPTD